MRAVFNSDILVASANLIKSTSQPKGFIPVAIIIIISVVAVAMVGAGVYYKVKKDSEPQVNSNASTNANITINSYVATNTNATTNTDNVAKSCIQDSDCTLRICGGCYNTDSLKDAPPDLPCRQYENYTCKCSNSICTEVEISSSTNTNTTIVDTAGWETYTNTDYGFSIQYPTIYKVKGDDHANELFGVLFEYPRELGGGIYVAVSSKSVDELVNDLWQAEDPRNIAGTMWQQYSYDPANDPGATDQSAGVRYLLEKDGRVYGIYTPTGVGWEGMSADEVDEATKIILSTFQFTE